MMRKSFYSLIVVFLILLNANLVFSQFAIKPKVYPFQLNQVQLLDSPFKHAMELDAEVLLKIKPDRLLHNFRENAGGICCWWVPAEKRCSPCWLAQDAGWT